MEETNEKSISVNSLLTLKDYLSFRFYMYLRSVSGILSAIVLINFSAIFIIGIPIIVFESIQRGDYSLLGVMLLIVPMSLVFFGLPFFLVYSPAKKHFESNKLLHREYNYVISKTGLNISRESSNSLINWSDVYKIIETKHTFAFFTSREQAIIIPRRYLLSEEVYLRNLLFSCVEQKKLKIKKLV